MKAANKRFGSVRFLAVSCAVITFAVCLAAGFGRPGHVLAGEAAGGGEPAPTATSTGTAPAPPTGTATAKAPEATGTSTARPPAATSTATAAGTGTGTATALPTGTSIRPAAPSGPKVKPKVRKRIVLIIDEIMKKHEGSPMDLIPLAEELAKMGLPAVEELVSRLSMETDPPACRAVMARAIARVTGWNLPYATRRDADRIREWWAKNKTKKAKQLQAERLKNLASRAKTESKYIELCAIADALGYVRGPEAISTIRLLLGPNYDDSLLRQKLLIALGKQETADIIPVVVLYLKSKDNGIVVSAITALGLSGAKKAKTHLTPLVSSKTISIRLAAVLALGRLGDRTQVKVLREIIEDKDKDKDKPEKERIWALNVLAEIGSFDDHKWLVDFLKTRNDFTFYHVGRTLEKLVGKTFGFTSADTVELNKRSKAVEEFKSWKVEVLRWPYEKHLVECLTDANWQFRKRALKELKKISKGEVESEYDPIAGKADCETKDDPWEYWVEGLEKK